MFGLRLLLLKFRFSPDRFDNICFTNIRGSFARKSALNGRLSLVEVLFLRGKSSTNMPLLFIDIQHFSCFLRKSRVNLQQPIRNIFMYRTLADSKFLLLSASQLLLFQ